LKSEFILNPDIVFLNHGSFGACPRSVFESYQHWQLELERQPVEFLGRQAASLMATARQKLAAFIGCSPDEVVYFPNPTTALNMVLRSLDLRPGDEILTTDHEYGACDRTWRFICGHSGARYIQQPIPLPVTIPDDFIESFWSGVNKNTRAIFLSHITSPTALIFPVEEICHRARQAGILTIIDGAHAPGQIPLNLAEIQADIYIGALHKWLMAPKGSAFLYAHLDIQPSLEPLVVSWGYDADPGFGSGNKFIDYHEWQGTRDLAAFLSVPAAIDFYNQMQWDPVRDRCHRLAAATRRRINELTGLPPISPETPTWFGQMCAIRLPNVDVDAFKDRLYEVYQIEVPLYRWEDQPLMRVSIQGYNTEKDVDRLVNALAKELS
jgi:isopenicillin-N epimerase